MSTKVKIQQHAGGYGRILKDVVLLLETARRTSVRAVNAAMTATYWQIGRYITEFEQRGGQRAEHYGEQLVKRLAADLTHRFGRGFSKRNLEQMRRFYLSWQIAQPVSAQSLPGPGVRGRRKIAQTLSAQSLGTALVDFQAKFPLPWSHYVRLLQVDNPHARAFYEAEALRGGWSFRQLDRQIDSQFYERTALSRNKAAMLTKGTRPCPNDRTSPEEEIKDPFVLEFLDLKLGKLTHADAGQMHLYLNYARAHWMHADENPPVGLILCASKDSAVAKYSFEGLPNKVVAAQYRTSLPQEKTLVAEIAKTQKLLVHRRKGK